MNPALQNPAYSLLMALGIVVSAFLWQKLSRKQPIPVLVFVAGLIGAVVGAKVGYFVFELPFHIHEPHLLWNMLLGRTILGGLLGGYAGVEWAKRQSDYHAATGDSFALIVPIGLAIGRIGCILQGCCLGRVCGQAWYATADATGQLRYPAPLIEAGFNLLFVGVAWILYRRGMLRGQLFHVYLAAYAVFRFVHEFARDTPRIYAGVSTYQILALIVLIVAVVRFNQRRREFPAPLTTDPIMS